MTARNLLQQAEKIMSTTSFRNDRHSASAKKMSKQAKGVLSDLKFLFRQGADEEALISDLRSVISKAAGAYLNRQGEPK